MLNAPRLKRRYINYTIDYIYYFPTDLSRIELCSDIEKSNTYPIPYMVDKTHLVFIYILVCQQSVIDKL